MKALILSEDNHVLSVIEVEDEAHLECVLVGGLPKILAQDIEGGDTAKVGDDLGAQVLAARERMNEETPRSMVQRIMRAIGIEV